MASITVYCAECNTQQIVNDDHDAVEDGEVQECPLCGFSEEVYEGTKEDYEEETSGGYVCDTCGEEFDTPQALAGHGSKH